MVVVDPDPLQVLAVAETVYETLQFRSRAVPFQSLHGFLQALA